MKLKIEVEGKTYEVEVEMVEGNEGFYMPQAAGPVRRTGPSGGPKRTSSAGPAPRPSAPVAAGKGAVTSPLAGNIWKVLVEPGQKVDPDQTMIIIEAMKMETNIMAPFAGTVKAVHVKPGDAVKVNQILVELEE